MTQDELTYTNAGQFPYPIFLNGGDARFLDSKGFPVGLFGFAEYGELRMRLPKQFVIALCSDGQGCLVLGAEDRRQEQLRASLRVESHRPLPDDVTLLLLKRG